MKAVLNYFRVILCLIPLAQSHRDLCCTHSLPYMSRSNQWIILVGSAGAHCAPQLQPHLQLPAHFRPRWPKGSESHHDFSDAHWSLRAQIQPRCYPHRYAAFERTCASGDDLNQDVYEFKQRYTQSHFNSIVCFYTHLSCKPTTCF